MEIICFAYPERLSALWALLPLSAFLGWGVWWKSRARRRLADDSLAVRLLGRWELRKEIVIRTMQLLSACLLFIAWCGPQLCSGEKLLRRQALDVVYVLDVSNSMLARDVEPDRLGRAKEEMLVISRDIDRGRRGLVAFAGSAVVQCPLTTDRQAFETMLSVTSPDLVEKQGTRIGAALDIASRMLSVPDRATRGAALRIIIIFSDGENHEGNAAGKARKLKEKGIQLVVVGVGAEEPVAVPLQNDEGGTDAVKLDAAGNPVLTSFNRELLAELAGNAGGAFLHSRETESVAGRVLEMLESKEAGTQWVREPRYREEIYHYFVLVSVLLLLGAGVLGSRY